MSQLSESRTTANTASEHLADHNELARLHNLLDIGWQTLILAGNADVTVAANPGVTIVLFQEALTAVRDVHLPAATVDSMTLIVQADVAAIADFGIAISPNGDDVVDGDGIDAGSIFARTLHLSNDSVDRWVTTDYLNNSEYALSLGITNLINELQDHKDSVAGAHVAVSISVDSATLSGTAVDLQAVLEEFDSRLLALEP